MRNGAAEGNSKAYETTACAKLQTVVMYEIVLAC